MVLLTPEADQHVIDLERHYEELGRIEAVRNLLLAIEEAKSRIVSSAGAGMPAPRPYPELKKLGRLWLKAGRYWFSYSSTNPPAITGVFFETANIPNRT